MTDDERFMRRALLLARRGKHTHPNPKVGAVIVRDGAVVGEGHHVRPGLPHAEAGAFAEAGDAARGATVYVTLEPCSHTANRDGSPRTACADRCIEAGVSRVVCAMIDPDTRVSGRGIERLRDAGIAVTLGVLETDARALNRPFVKHRETGLPFVLHKAAMTLDGKIATVSGSSRWVTGAESREYVHRVLRGTADAIVVGVGTVLSDNPSLDVRTKSRNVHAPVRVVVDSGLRTPINAKVAAPGTIFYTLETAGNEARAELLAATGATVARVEADDTGRVCIAAAMRDLAERGALSVLLEAGGELAASFYAARLVDSACVFVAPKIVGGRGAPTPIGGAGLAENMNAALRTGTLTVRRFGADIALFADIRYDD
ncbi:MAG: bifunctional diaminohydroxyphosphoribosylaminopyrimidine deaminase/5-amino-6-(5-phosphoribosylamino)uracil reductase RibD [Armatimonadetes bacterium]|nr:bifunctional diaminohydroxyphosphoribosylaminopyrimidine deaminase/5-amino-6-(5-phosphoribosylamino)uracil reductase RibD [Armatimonadota bacterium]